MATYQSITLEEMFQFLYEYSEGAVQPFHIQGSMEMVYQWPVTYIIKKAVPSALSFVLVHAGDRAMRSGGTPIKQSDDLIMRVYTSIARSVNGQLTSRKVGEDAIRCVLFARHSTRGYVPIVKARRVHRVSGWRENLQSRLDELMQSIPPRCMRCGAYMVLRTLRNRRLSTNRAIIGTGSGKVAIKHMQKRYVSGEAEKGQFYGCVEYPVCKHTRSVETA